MQMRMSEMHDAAPPTDELELVGEGQFAEQTDRRQRHPRIGQPSRLRRIGQQKRHAGREAQA